MFRIAAMSVLNAIIGFMSAIVAFILLYNTLEIDDNLKFLISLVVAMFAMAFGTALAEKITLPVKKTYVDPE